MLRDVGLVVPTQVSDAPGEPVGRSWRRERRRRSCGPTRSVPQGRQAVEDVDRSPRRRQASGAPGSVGADAREPAVPFRRGGTPWRPAPRCAVNSAVYTQLHGLHSTPRSAPPQPMGPGSLPIQLPPWFPANPFPSRKGSSELSRERPQILRAPCLSQGRPSVTTPSTPYLTRRV